MTQEQVIEMVEEMGLPCAYDHFAEGQSPEPPFLVFLYPEYKSAELEERVEAVLERHGIFYTKSEVWIESERLFEVLYGMEV